MNSINLIFRHVQVSGTSESFANRLYFCFAPCFPSSSCCCCIHVYYPGLPASPLQLLESGWLGRLLPCWFFNPSYFPRVEKHSHAGGNVAAGAGKGRAAPLTVQSMWLFLVRALLASCLSTSGPRFHHAWLLFFFFFLPPALSPRSQRPQGG